MSINSLTAGNTSIAEIIDDGLILRTVQDALDLMDNSPFANIVVYEHNLPSVFFDLKTGLAGEILQKCTNYRVRLAIIGDFSKYTSNALKAFIYESNKRKDHLFVSSLNEVKLAWMS